MKKEAAIIRHPHYPEIIKFKTGSLKTISTLSNSNMDEDLNNFEKLSFPGDGYSMYAPDNLSVCGDNEKSGCTNLNHTKLSHNNNLQLQT